MDLWPKEAIISGRGSRRISNRSNSRSRSCILEVMLPHTAQSFMHMCMCASGWLGWVGSIATLGFQLIVNIINLLDNLPLHSFCASVGPWIWSSLELITVCNSIDYTKSRCVLKQVPFLFGFTAIEKVAFHVIHWIFGRTGKHLFLSDCDEGDLPLLLRMVDDSHDLYFMYVHLYFVLLPFLGPRVQQLHLFLTVSNLLM